MTVCTKLLVSMGGVTLHRRGGHAFAGQHQGARILFNHKGIRSVLRRNA